MASKSFMPLRSNCAATAYGATAPSSSGITMLIEVMPPDAIPCLSVSQFSYRSLTVTGARMGTLSSRSIRVPLSPPPMTSRPWGRLMMTSGATARIMPSFFIPNELMG